jgi:hypothetical protein
MDSDQARIITTFAGLLALLDADAALVARGSHSPAQFRRYTFGPK